MNLISYGRVSTQDQDLTIYMDQPRSFCKRHGHVLIKEFADHDVSAGIPFKERPQGSLAYQMLVEKRADGIIASETSRVFRDVEDGIVTMNYFSKIGISMFYCDDYTNEPISIDTPHGFRSAITPLIDAHMERLKIKYRTKKAMQYRRENNMVTSHAPFGFDVKDGMLVANNLEMRVVEIIFDLHKEGLSYKSIADTLNINSIPTKLGKGAWYGKVIKGIIQFHLSSKV